MGLYSSIELDPEVEPCTKSAERLVSLRSSVAPDGEATSFFVAFTNQKPFELLVPFSDMANIFSEIRHAQSTMARRQQLTLDRGATRLLELCEQALRPMHVDYVVDPPTGDVIFLHQFEDHAPLALRVAPADLAYNIGEMMRVIRHSRH